MVALLTVVGKPGLRDAVTLRRISHAVHVRYVRYERIEVDSTSHEVNIPLNSKHVLASEAIAPSGLNASITLQEKGRAWPAPSLAKTLACERVVAVPTVSINLSLGEALRQDLLRNFFGRDSIA